MKYLCNAMRRNNMGTLGTTLAYVVSVSLFALPLILAIAAGAEHQGESVSYRYFGSARIMDGNPQGVWFPQGFLISTVHHLIYLFIDSVLALPIDDIRTRLNTFGYLSNTFIVLLNSAVVLACFRNRNFSGTDKALVIFVSLAPVLVTGSAGIYYSNLPDYYHLNMVIITMSSAIFISNLRSFSDIRRYRKLTVLGCIIGLAASNKITMLPIATVSLLPLVVHFRTWPLGSRVAAILTIGVASITTFILIVLAFYAFHIDLVQIAFAKFASFVSNTRMEPGFLSTLSTYLFGHSYAYAIGMFFACALFARLSQARVASRTDNGPLVIWYVIVIAGLTYLWFVIKKPAGTTFFESVNALFGLSAMLLASIHAGRIRRIATYLVLGVAGGYAVSNNALAQAYRGMESGLQVTEKGWQLFYEAQSFRKQVIVVIPDNEYHWEDPHESLLKGLSDCPSWEINRAQLYLDRLKSPIVFRTEQGGPKPDEPYPETAVIVWTDRLDLPPLPKRYPNLADAIASRVCKSIDIDSSKRANLCYPRDRVGADLYSAPDSSASHH